MEFMGTKAKGGDLAIEHLLRCRCIDVRRRSLSLSSAVNLSKVPHTMHA